MSFVSEKQVESEKQWRDAERERVLEKAKREYFEKQQEVSSLKQVNAGMEWCILPCA